MGALSSAVAAAPVALLVDGFCFPLFSVAQWEFDVDALAAACALFAVTYRYVVRDDANAMLRQGVIGAFAIACATASVRVSDTCIAASLRALPDAAVLGQGLGALAVGDVALGAAGAAMDYVLAKGWITPFPGTGGAGRGK